MNRLTIVLSGRKQSGKSSSCNYIRAKYLNKKRGNKDLDYFIDDEGLLRARFKRHEVACSTCNRTGVIGWGLKLGGDPAALVPCIGCNLMGYNYQIEKIMAVTEDGRIVVPDQYRKPIESISEEEINSIADYAVRLHDVKIYSFADPLKSFCINVLGVPYECCYGTDAQKNTPQPHLLWENLNRAFHPPAKKTVTYPAIYNEFSGESRAEITSEETVYKTGPMTAREIMQIFGTEMIRKLYADAWARGTYNAIKSDGFELALVTDGRFPNEITMGTEVKAKSLRLLRAVHEDSHESEWALDGFPVEKYTLVLDNREMTLEEQCRFLDPIIDQWFEEAGI